MEEILGVLSENKVMTVVVILAIFMIIYYIVKSIVKIGIVLLAVSVVMGGYLYFKNPENRPEDVKDALNKAKAGTSEVLKKGKSACQESRELVQKGTDSYKKGTEIVKSSKGVLEKGIEKGKEIIKKGIDKTEDIIKSLKKESDNK
jgi:hypothetical protein